MGARQFTDLKVWQEAATLAEEIYAGTELFPPEEKYGFVAQMRRAVASIPANIAEGFSRSHPRERARFYEIAKSSAEELRSEILLSRRLRFPPLKPEIEERLDSVCKMLYRLRQLVLSDLK
jgi:four helix bundle protein